MKLSAFVAFVSAVTLLPLGLTAQQTVTGQAAFADWNQQEPSVRRKITLADLPGPKPEEAVRNTAHVIPRPADAWPLAPAGFKVILYAGGDAKPMQRADNKEHMDCGAPYHAAPHTNLLRMATSSLLTLVLALFLFCVVSTAQGHQNRKSSPPVSIILWHRLLSRRQSEIHLCWQCTPCSAFLPPR